MVIASFFKKRIVGLCGVSLIFFIMLTAANHRHQYHIYLPYRQAGFTKEQAAAYLLNRFTYGPKPGEVQRVENIGLSKWFMNQLNESNKSPILEMKLRNLDAIQLSTSQIFNLYPKRNRVIHEAISAGVLAKNYKSLDKDVFRATMRNFMQQRGYRPINELLDQLKSQKILRSVYDNNQLEEILTDFWFNHFNVTINNGKVRPYVLSYERDAIRPFVLSHFQDLLLATAKHPAMIYYLNNAENTCADSIMSTSDYFTAEHLMKAHRNRRFIQIRLNKMHENRIRQSKRNHNKGGINENYGREVMELQTLGVNGGYTQIDVEQLARILTGWSVFPQNPKQVQKYYKNKNRLDRVGFVREGDFLFRANLHDAGKKIFLNHVFPAGGGFNEGKRALKMLAENPATAHHICHELAMHFASDHPDEKMVDQMAKTYQYTHGDIKKILITMVESRGFWNKNAFRSKIKSPLEFITSAIRSLNADVTNTKAINNWLTKMGEPLYAYLAPTGYPDSSSTWVNAGSLMNRLNFGMQLSFGKIRGIKVNLLRLNHNRVPNTVFNAFNDYAKILLPGRNTRPTIKTLSAAINHTDFKRTADKMNAVSYTTLANRPYHQWMAEVVGILIGSPEFQHK